MNVFLWIITILLAVVFLGAGFMKASTTKEKLSAKMAWATDFSTGQIKTIGVLEILGAIGLVVPGLFKIVPILVPISALCLALLMAGAVVVHIRRKDGGAEIMPGAVLCLLCFLLAIARFGPYPL